LQRRRLRYAASRRARAKPVLEALSVRWPAVFPAVASEIRPWPIGLLEEMVARHPEHPRGLIRGALDRFARTEAYQLALARGGPRFGLDGQPAGEVTAEQQARATEALEKLRRSRP
jgi:ProP effector